MRRYDQISQATPQTVSESSQTKKIGAKCRICGTELHITIDSNKITDIPSLVVNGKKIDPNVARQAAEEVEKEL